MCRHRTLLQAQTTPRKTLPGCSCSSTQLCQSSGSIDGSTAFTCPAVYSLAATQHALANAAITREGCPPGLLAYIPACANAFRLKRQMHHASLLTGITHQLLLVPARSKVKVKGLAILDCSQPAAQCTQCCVHSWSCHQVIIFTTTRMHQNSTPA